MDRSSLPQRTWSLEEGGSPGFDVHHTTSRRGLGPPPLLRDHLRGEERPIDKTHRPGALWADSPILKQSYYVDEKGLVERIEPQWDPLVPTEVVIDTPLLNVNKPLLLPEPLKTPFPSVTSQPPYDVNEPFDTQRQS